MRLLIASRKQAESRGAEEQHEALTKVAAGTAAGENAAGEKAADLTRHAHATTSDNRSIEQRAHSRAEHEALTKVAAVRLTGGAAAAGGVAAGVAAGGVAGDTHTICACWFDDVQQHLTKLSSHIDC